MESLFAAIKLVSVPRLIGLVRNTQVLLRKERIKWVPDLELHIRLASIDLDVTSDDNEVIKRLEKILKEEFVFDCKLKGFGNFGSHSLWVGVEQSPELLSLRTKINTNISDIREVDSIENMPHVLLARINHLKDKRLFFKIVDANRIIDFGNFEVSKICLMKTELKSYGSVASVISTIPLKALVEEELG